MNYPTDVVEKVVEEIVAKAKAFLIEQGHEGFATKENPRANDLQVHDIPGFITDLQNEDILDGEFCYTYVQFTVDNLESSYEDMSTKFIVFSDGLVKAVIKFDEVIGMVDWEYKGLTEEGFRALLKAMM